MIDMVSKQIILCRYYSHHILFIDLQDIDEVNLYVGEGLLVNALSERHGLPRRPSRAQLRLPPSFQPRGYLERDEIHNIVNYCHLLLTKALGVVVDPSGS